MLSFRQVDPVQVIRHAARVLDGKAIAKSIRDQVRVGIREAQKTNAGFEPGLAIVQVGDRSDSNVYIRNKLKAAEEVGINATHVKLPSCMTQLELIQEIDRLNKDPKVQGTIVQLPLDLLDSTRQIDADAVINRILAEKDVDGLCRENAGRLARGELEGTVIPCTPRGCLALVQSTGTQIKGKNVVVLGRSKIVGMPAAELFLWHNATVTTCHSRTVNLEAICREADILIVAIGKPEFVKGEWIKPGAIVIDCGINAGGPPGLNGKAQLLGDVDFDEAAEVASYITPVPGGVGPMTVAMLLQNTFEQAKRSAGRTASKQASATWHLSHLPLRLQEPVPSDIEISRAQRPKDMTSSDNDVKSIAQMRGGSGCHDRSRVQES